MPIIFSKNISALKPKRTVSHVLSSTALNVSDKKSSISISSSNLRTVTLLYISRFHGSVNESLASDGDNGVLIPYCLLPTFITCMFAVINLGSVTNLSPCNAAYKSNVSLGSPYESKLVVKLLVFILYFLYTAFCVSLTHCSFLLIIEFLAPSSCLIKPTVLVSSWLGKK